MLLSQYLGTDLSRISNELQKLKMILKNGEILDEKTIETHIGISKDFNIFELIKSLGKKDAVQSYKIAHFLGKSAKQNPFPTVLSHVSYYYSPVAVKLLFNSDSFGPMIRLYASTPGWLNGFTPSK